jgi:hypothetical protein
MKKSDSACRAIRAASTEAEVIGALRNYLASLGAAQMALIPAEIVAIGIRHAEEVVQSALQLVHREMLETRDAVDAAVLSEVALVFSTAAQRLTVLAKDPA